MNDRNWMDQMQFIVSLHCDMVYDAYFFNCASGIFMS